MWFLLYKMIRPILPISGGLAAWIISQACGAEPKESLAAAASIALSTIGASLYHYGGANWMYARKSDRLKFDDPEIVRLLGLGVFCLSIAVAVLFLPKQCALICLFNTLVIAAYSAKLSAVLIIKNLTMCVICTTPIVIGWQAGDATHPIVPWAIAIAAIAHLAREVIKDVKDILANEGKRFTVPMWLDEETALQCAGGLLLIATVLALFILPFTENSFQASFVVLSEITFLATGIFLIFAKKAWRAETAIHLSLGLILIGLL